MNKTIQQPRAWHILSLAIPTLLVLAATPLYLLWDTAVVSSQGTIALAALATGATIYAQLTTQLTFLSYGTTSRAAYHYGAGRTRAAIYEGIQATWIAVCVGGILGCFLFFSAESIAALLSPSPQVVEEGSRWLSVVSCAIPAALIAMAGHGWLRGISDARTPLYCTIFGLAPMAIFIPWAVHRYGLMGSAYATALGEWIIALAFLTVLWSSWSAEKEESDTQGEDEPMSWKPHLTTIAAQLRQGRDLLIRSLSFQISAIAAVAVLGRSGDSSLAAHQILLQIWNFLTLLMDSVAIAAQSIIGAYVGAQRKDKIPLASRTILRFNLLLGCALIVFLWLGRELIFSLFTSDTEVVEELAHSWWILLLMVLIGSFVFALDGILLGASDIAFLRNVTVCSVLVVSLPIIILSSRCGWGIEGIWGASCGLLIARAVGVGGRYHYLYRSSSRKKEKFRKEKTRLDLEL